MKTKHFSIKVLLGFLLTTCILSTTYAEIPFTEAKGLYAATRDEYKHISPFWGMVAIHGKLLERIRFFGFYQRQDNGPDKPLDDSDYIEKLLLTLFPSPDGAQLVANAKDDFFKALNDDQEELKAINDIIEMLLDEKEERKKKLSEIHAIIEGAIKKDQTTKKEDNKKKKDTSNRLSNLLMAAYEQQRADDFFREFSKKGKTEAIESIIDILTKSKRGTKDKEKISGILKIVEQVAGDSSIHRNTIKFLLDASKQKTINLNPDDYFQQRYPENIVIISLLSYVVKVARNKEQIINSLPLLFNPVTETDKVDTYTKQAYEDNKASFPTIVQDLSNPTNVELAFFLAKGFEAYGNLIAEPITYLQQSVLIDGAIAPFSDCGETSLRNFFMLLLSAGNGGIVSAQNLEAFEKAVLESNTGSITNAEKINTDAEYKHYRRFKSFIKNHPDITSGASSVELYNAWAEIVSDLNDGKSPTTINDVQYGCPKKDKEDKVYEIKANDSSIGAIGLINMFNVIAKIIPDQVLRDGWSDDKSKRYEQIEQKLTRLCNLFSSDDIDIEWKDESTGKPKINSEFVTIIFTINEEDAFEWSFEKNANGGGHFDIQRLSALKGDWRVKFSYLPYYPNEWMASLFPRPLDTKQNLEAAANYANLFPITIIYNPLLRTVQGIIGTVSIVLDKKMEGYYPLIKRWAQHSIHQNNPNFLIDITASLNGLSNRLEERESKQRKGEKKQEKGKEKEDDEKEEGDKTKEKEAIKNAINGAIDMAKQKGMLQQNIVTLALKSNQPHIAQIFIKAGAEHISKDDSGNTPLHLAVSKGYKNVWMLLIKDKDTVVLNVVNNDGNTPLHLALKRLADSGLAVSNPARLQEEIEILNSFIEGGPNVNLINNAGDTPLHLASILQNSGAAEKLLEVGAKINLRDREGNTPLHIAISQYSEPVCKLLIKNTADLNIKNNEGNTPLYVALSEDNMDALKLLIESKAQLNVQNNAGDTPLHLAIRRKSDALEPLIKAGASLDIVGTDRNTPLHLAVNKRNRKAIEELLRRGANTKAINKNGKTLIMSLIESITESDIRDMHNVVSKRRENIPDFIQILDLLVDSNYELQEEEVCAEEDISREEDKEERLVRSYIEAREKGYRKILEWLHSLPQKSKGL
jgi:ankyrin repeat protein